MAIAARGTVGGHPESRPISMAAGAFQLHIPDVEGVVEFSVFGRVGLLLDLPVTTSTRGRFRSPVMTGGTGIRVQFESGNITGVSLLVRRVTAFALESSTHHVRTM